MLKPQILDIFLSAINTAYEDGIIDKYGVEDAKWFLLHEEKGEELISSVAKAKLPITQLLDIANDFAAGF